MVQEHEIIYFNHINNKYTKTCVEYMFSKDNLFRSIKMSANNLLLQELLNIVVCKKSGCSSLREAEKD